MDWGVLLGVLYLLGAVFFSFDFFAWGKRCGQDTPVVVAIGIAVAWPLIALQMGVDIVRGQRGGEE